MHQFLLPNDVFIIFHLFFPFCDLLYSLLFAYCILHRFLLNLLGIIPFHQWWATSLREGDLETKGLFKHKMDGGKF